MNDKIKKLLSPSPKLVAFFLAVLVSSVTVSFLSLLNEADGIEMLVAGSMSFASCFILFYITLEFLIYKEISIINQSLDKLTRKNLQPLTQQIKSSQNPLQELNQQIASYAELKEREVEELKKLAAFRREFIADVSHELKTPIFAIQGALLTLTDGSEHEAEIKERFMKNAVKNVNALAELVDDLLTLSQIESGVIVMKVKDFDILYLADDVFAQLESKAEKRNIELRFDKDYNAAIMVKGDEARIRQVLINLVNNAIKYGNDNGFVEIRFAETSKSVRITVADNGPGIAPEHLGRIFERFYRIDKSRTRRIGGTGLGLAIVKHILESHQARIQVRSVVNQGTEFTFKLPKTTPTPKITQPTTQVES